MRESESQCEKAKVTGLKLGRGYRLRSPQWNQREHTLEFGGVLLRKQYEGGYYEEIREWVNGEPDDPTTRPVATRVDNGFGLWITVPNGCRAEDHPDYMEPPDPAWEKHPYLGIIYQKLINGEKPAAPSFSRRG